jgi:allantoinase
MPAHASRLVGKAAAAALALAVALIAPPRPAFGQDAKDWVTGLPRSAIHVKSWPKGRKVAICFVLYVEVWGYGQGPNLRSDLNGRDPDVVDEAFRQYGIDWASRASAGCSATSRRRSASP